MKPWLLALLCLAVSPLAAADIVSMAREVDALLAKGWTEQGVKRNPDADDSTFVRRIYLDLVGRIPTARETEAFLGSEAPDKRVRLIDQLLGSEGQVCHAFNYWADVLRLQTTGAETGKYSGVAYQLYLRDSLRANTPYDEFVRQLITAQGKAWNNGAVGYYMRDRNMPLENLANTARIFLGTRIECAQCHNHPFDKWTQIQFYQLAAYPYVIAVDDYFSGNMGKLRSWMNNRETKLKRDPGKAEEYERAVEEDGYISQALNTLRNYIRYTEHYVEPRRILRLPHDYQYTDAKPFDVIAPASLMGPAIKPRGDETPLAAYARWLTSPENPRFTTVIVNRLWKRAFGRALIEPLDELMDGSQATNPALLKRLEAMMREMRYDMRAFMAMICNTQAYQSMATQEEVEPGGIYHFTGPLLRRMSAEQMWDSLITLINTSPDAPNALVRHRLQNHILAAQKLVDAVDALAEDEVISGARAAAVKYKERALHSPAAQQELDELTAKGDVRAAQETRSRLNHLLFDPHGMINHEVVHRGMIKLAARLNTVPVIYHNGSDGKLTEVEASLDAMKSATGVLDPKDFIFIKGHYDRPEMTEKQREAMQKARQALWQEEASYFHLPPSERTAYFGAREGQTDQWLRAADLESPSPIGHYLREFGQSDRVTIENANQDASIPQALALMNGELMPQVLGCYSQIMLTVRQAKDADAQVGAVYRALFCRAPTDREMKAWTHARESGLTSIEDLIWALLNTQRFIFVE